jgi:hypothetical protein
LLEAFWTSLIVLDLIATALLLSRFRRSALLMSAAIMLADVVANTYAMIVLDIAALSLAVPLQATFLGYVLGSLPFLWPRPTSGSEHKP